MTSRSRFLTRCAIAIFLGSALLFFVQPMIGKAILPRFGGTAAVWTACLVTFQVLLLAGYGYTVQLTRFSLQRQVAIHLVFLFVTVVWPADWFLGGIGQGLPQELDVFLTIAFSFGPAYLVLASGSALIQSWLAKTWPEQNVYQLYAISNAGSLIGLFAYPFLVEPFLSGSIQQKAWWCFFGVYGVIISLLGFRMLHDKGNSTTNGPYAPDMSSRDSGAPGSNSKTNIWSARSWWWALPFLNTFLLTAETSTLTLDVTPMPLIWCLLLGAFLLGYIGGFTSFGERLRSLWGSLSALSIAGHVLMRWVGYSDLLPSLAAGVGVILFGGLFLNSWLYAIRPKSNRLPLYYLGIAAGGALGGMAAGIAAPLLFNGILEYNLILITMTILIASRLSFDSFRRDKMEMSVCVVSAVIVLIGEPRVAFMQSRQSLFRERNFYGTLKVNETEALDINGRTLGVARTLVNGATTHGLQFRNPALRWKGTSYYGRNGGGLPILTHPGYAKAQGLRVGVVGLGIGTLAVYGREGDFYRFYEINPQVVEVARNTNYFTCLADTAARVDVVIEDARKALERENASGEDQWDVLIIDAFSGDSVPVHLLTREAVTLYLDRLAEDGVLAFHISNRFLDLLPLLRRLAEDAGVKFYAWINKPQETALETESHWILMSRQERALPLERTLFFIQPSQIPMFPLVTDQFGSVLNLIDWRRTRIRGYMPEKKGPYRGYP